MVSDYMKNEFKQKDSDKPKKKQYTKSTGREMAGATDEIPDTARVITFNCLSPHYAYKEWFPQVREKYIEEKYRLDKLCKLIKSWMKGSYIIGLQELCDTWQKRLLPLCSQNSYHMTYTAYSEGKMGVAILFPTSGYELLDTDIIVPHDLLVERKGALSGVVTSSTIERNNAHAVAGAIRDAENPTKPFVNTQITLLLRVLRNGGDAKKELIVSTYHAPCRFTNQIFMICHAHRVTEHLRTLYDRWTTESDERGYLEPESISTVFLGDMNTVSTNLGYSVLTSGTRDRSVTPSGDGLSSDSRFGKQSVDDVIDDVVDDSDSSDSSDSYDPFADNGVPQTPYEAVRMAYANIGVDFDYDASLVSAHYELEGREPTFTNVKKADPKEGGDDFIETIDYILISQSVSVISSIVGLTPKPGKAVSAFPNAICPSDHLPLSASLTIP